MEYIVHRRFKTMAICGEVNLPAGTVCEEVGGVIRADGKNLCLVRSENAHQYFARNDDGNGMERGQLTQRIQKTLQKQDAEHQARWDKIWDDAQCQAYRREEHKDYWLWNHAFYEADMMTLRHIAALVGA